MLILLPLRLFTAKIYRYPLPRHRFFLFWPTAHLPSLIRSGVPRKTCWDSFWRIVEDEKEAFEYLVQIIISKRIFAEEVEIYYCQSLYEWSCDILVSDRNTIMMFGF